jgi:hypothetical protein
MSVAALTPIVNSPGGYRFLPSLRFASGGVLSLPGMAMERAVLTDPQPLDEAFPVIKRHLGTRDRAMPALCGIELRSPAQITMSEFVQFNDRYLAHLDAHGLLRDGVPPLTRTNVAPFAHAPATPLVLAFYYTVPDPRPTESFVISGVAEVATGLAYPDDIVRPGETSADALLAKARSVVDDVTAILDRLGGVWDEAVSVHLYSVHPVAFDLVRSVLAGIGVAPRNGIVWHDAAPPVDGLELEVDIRRYAREHALVRT